MMRLCECDKPTCPICGLAARRPEYAARFASVAERLAGRSIRTRPPLVRKYDCIHLGPVIERRDAQGRERRCESVYLRQCDVHGVCRVGQRWAGACCNDNCSEYESESESAPIEEPALARPATKPAAFTVRTVARFDEGNFGQGRGGWRFNGSIIDDSGGFVLAARTGWAGSKIIVGRLDAELRPVGQTKVLPLRRPESRVGREDPRLFRFAGKLHVAFIGVEPWQTGVRTNMLYARLSDDLAVEDRFYPQYSRRREWEKNWQFFDYAGELFAVYRMTPFQVLRICGNHAELVYEHDWSPNWKGGELRGGAPPVRVGDEFWSFVHDKVDDAGMPLYRTALYTFDAHPPFRPRRIAPSPVMVADKLTNTNNYAHTVFTCGAVRCNGRWLTASGVHDRWLEVHELQHDELDAALERCPLGKW